MAFIIVLLCLIGSAQLWRMGGDGNKLFRCIGVPSLIGVLKMILLLLTAGFSWWVLLAVLYIPALWAMIQMFSYGITSPVHKFWVWILGKGAKGSNGNDILVEFCTRATCGFFWALPSLIFAFITTNWVLCSLYIVFLTVANGYIGAYVKDVEISERLVGASVGLSILV